MTPNAIARAALSAIIAVGAISNTAHAQVLHFINGHWYDGSTFTEREFYAVDGVLHEKWDGGHVATVDLGGGYVVPPFGDAHTHAIGNDNFPHENQHFLSKGIFYVANPNSIASTTAAAREAANAAGTVDATFANGGLTCGGGHPIQIFEGRPGQSELAGNAYYVVDDAQMLESVWPQVVSKHPDFIKIYLERSEHHAERKDDPDYYGKRGLDPAVVPAIVERAHAAGLRVAAHVTSQYDFHVAVTAGVDEIAHLPLEPIAEADARAAAERGITLVTTALSHRPTDGVDDIDALHRSNIKILSRAGVPIVLGTDSHASVIDEVMKLQSIGALSDADLLRMLVHDTPKWIFPEREIGVLADGAEANLVVLEANPLDNLAALRQIQGLYKNGAPVELDADAEKPPGIGQQLVHTVMSRGTDAAIAEYHRMREEEADEWDFSEPQLNALGYAMINHGKAAEAIAIFKLNCEQFPKSSNVWDSLGDAYAEAGDIAKAKESYQRALEINPQNEGSREKLAKLE